MGQNNVNACVELFDPKNFYECEGWLILFIVTLLWSVMLVREETLFVAKQLEC